MYVILTMPIAKYILKPKLQIVLLLVFEAVNVMGECQWRNNSHSHVLPKINKNTNKIIFPHHNRSKGYNASPNSICVYVCVRERGFVFLQGPESLLLWCFLGPKGEGAHRAIITAEFEDIEARNARHGHPLDDLLSKITPKYRTRHCIHSTADRRKSVHF